jgi:2-keto-4-pentenoate hydratase/2-oxohepta-3-ene-1,7-dioic acid hydratase in catechol pathway
MRLISYQSDGGARVAAGRDVLYCDLNRADPALPTSMIELLAGGPEMLRRAQSATAKAEPLPAGSVRILPPVPRPPKIFGVGLNYADHARETGKEPPAEPVIFSKLPTSIAAHEQPIVLPMLSKQVDYEAELVVVIGRGGRHIRLEAAMEHVAGYCCGHDVSARDWQHHKPGGQWLLGKSFDTFGPFGPELVTADEIPDPGGLHIQLRINGRTMQDSSTRQLIFSVAELIAYISGVCTLETGDIIFTGTPPGVGAAHRPPVFLQPGDVVEIEIEKIGVLRNPVVAEQAG